jgi:hypothetical protein
MQRSEVVRRFFRGEVLLVGEYRSARAESDGYVDRRTGEALVCVRCIYLIECACLGTVDRSIIYHRRPDITDPELAAFPYEKGKLYVFFLEGFKRERGNFIGWTGRGPEPIEDDMEAGATPAGAAPAP